MIVELTNHLWQSTLFAAVAGLLTLAFRKNRAQVRYWLWFSASLKFFVPFSLLMALGSHLGLAPVAKSVATPAVSITMEQLAQPFPSAVPSTPSTRATTVDWIPMAILGVWASGFAAIALIRFRGWLRIRAVVRSSSPLETAAPVEVRSSPGLLEPGVVGFLRPILVLPEGILERLTLPQLQAVLAHELCHVRRRDNLCASIHMIVEALFWFHPLVWWIGARLIEERERACDEGVLSLGCEPRVYVEAILNVCKLYVESPLVCVSGVTGSNLKRRIEAILTNRAGQSLNRAKKFLLASAGVAALAVPVVIGVVLGVSNAPAIRAQSPTAVTPKFEVASIKPCQAFSKSEYLDAPPGTFHSGCTTVQRLIQQAYGLFASGHMNPGSSLTVTGGPSWTTSDLYQIDAKAEAPQSRATMNGPMLQTVLEDRFRLRVHRDTREVPIYALTVAERGPKLQPFQGSCTPRDFDRPPSDADCGRAGGLGNGFHMTAASMADLCEGFSVLLNRPVIDKTGLAGRFDMHVDLPAEDRGLLNRPRSLPAETNPTAPPPPPIPFDAAKTAIQKLGLNLEPTEGPGEFLVIDHVERPSGD